MWDFIKLRKLPYCSLYDEGFERLGCVGCPMAPIKQRLYEFKRYPKRKISYINAFNRMLEERRKRGLKTEWETGEDVMKWWLSQ